MSSMIVRADGSISVYLEDRINERGGTSDRDRLVAEGKARNVQALYALNKSLLELRAGLGSLSRDIGLKGHGDRAEQAIEHDHDLRGLQIAHVKIKALVCHFAILLAIGAVVVAKHIVCLGLTKADRTAIVLKIGDCSGGRHEH